MFGSCNFTWGPNILYEISKGVPTPNGSGSVTVDPGASAADKARWARWTQLEAAYRGKGAIDPEVAMQFEGDNFDTTNGMNHSAATTASRATPPVAFRRQPPTTAPPPP